MEMTETARLVLVVSDRPWICDRLHQITTVMTGFELQVADDTESAVPLVEQHSFDLVVIDHPAKGKALQKLLRAVRRRDSPSRQAALVVLSEPETLEEAEQLFGQGATRILNPIATDERLRLALKDVLEHPPRFPLRALVKFLPADAPSHARAFAQTENLSLTGMLVRHEKLLPVGGRLTFDLELPGQGSPIRGVAVVVRLICGAEDDVTGFAARFVNLDGDGQRRLELALERLAQQQPTPTA